MDTVKCIGLMEASIKVHGRMGFNMVKVKYTLQDKEQKKAYFNRMCWLL